MNRTSTACYDEAIIGAAYERSNRTLDLLSVADIDRAQLHPQ